MSRGIVDSGIKWIGTLPDTWKITTVNKIFFRRKEINNEENPIILSLSRDGVKIRDITTNEGQLAESYDNYHKVYKDDLMINPMDLISGANCSLSEVEGVISPAYINLAKKEKIYPKYYDYFFKYQYWINAMFIHGKGVSFDNRWTINWETMANYKLPLPSYDEQIKISNYLDDKVSLIDDTIENNKREIELLEEYKKNIFSDVIKEYNFKNYKLKYLINKKLQYGANSSGVVYRDDLPRYVRITDILNNTLKEQDKLSLHEDEAKDFILKDGDILFARSGGTVGKSFMYENKFGRCAFAGYLIRASFNNKELAQYVYNFTNSVLYEKWKNSIFIQSTIQNIGADKYSNMLIPIPIDFDNVVRVNNKINKIIIKLDKVIKYRNQIIEKLEEYKKSLIYEAVTGKIEV